MQTCCCAGKQRMSERTVKQQTRVQSPARFVSWSQGKHLGLLLCRCMQLHAAAPHVSSGIKASTSVALHLVQCIRRVADQLAQGYLGAMVSRQALAGAKAQSFL